MVKIAIIQARLSSKRLPGKVLKDLYGKTLLDRVINQVKKSKKIDQIWVATSNNKEDDLIEIHCNRIGVNVFRGSLNNVLERFCGVITQTGAEIVVRITADNPLTNHDFIDEGINSLLSTFSDYLYYENIPYGSGIEVVRSSALLSSLINSKDTYDQEHVTPYIKKHKESFKITKCQPSNKKIARPDISITIDTLEDYINLYKLFSHIEGEKEFYTLDDVIEIIDNNFNNLIRNEKGN